MTPSARLSAAIDILGEIGKGRVADRVLSHWAKSNRYAGSKDRAAIQERVFDVLRNRALYAHGMRQETPRALVLASLLRHDGMPSDEAGQLFDGVRFAPQPLSEEERTALEAFPSEIESAPEHVRLNLPDWLVPELQQAFGEGFEQEIAALNERAPLDLRVNMALTNREVARQRLADEGIETEATPWSPWGLRSTTKARVTHTATYKDGWVEVQDEGSQLACLAAHVAPGEQVVDLCAGAGGKALALSAALQGEGHVVACDTDPRRLGRLLPRAERAGAGALETRRLKPFDPDSADPDLGDLEGRIDCIFIDAPCSGTGTWRRQPEARWQLTPEKLDAYRAAQAEVLVRGGRLVRPGGRLVYVTCSVLGCENEAQIDAFLSEFPQFSAASWQHGWPDEAHLPPVPDGLHLRLTPHTSGTDGFFVCILERHG